MNVQKSHIESEAVTGFKPKGQSSSQVIRVLSVCMALQMTSFVMIMPLFARRFSKLGAGVEALGLSAMAYALTSTLAAPFMGALADLAKVKPSKAALVAENKSYQKNLSTNFIEEGELVP